MNTVISNDGTKLAYNIFGSGPPLIYITGATCFRNFTPVLYDSSVFATEFKVYNYDRRGRGDSKNKLPYFRERELEDIIALIDKAGGKESLYGHSSGAILALEVAMMMEDKVEKIALYDCSYSPNKKEQNEFINLGNNLRKYLEQGKYEEAINRFYLGIGLPAEAFIYFRQSPDWSTMVALAPTLAYDIRLASDIPPLESLADFKVPTHIIVGENSPQSIYSVADQLKKSITDATFTKLKGQDHMPDPESVLGELTKFLK